MNNKNTFTYCYSENGQVKGTKVYFGNLSKLRKKLIIKFISFFEFMNYDLIEFPNIINKSDLDLVGDNTDLINKEMFVAHYEKKKCDSTIVLRPEFTAVIANFIDKYYTSQKTIKIIYYGNCFRYERPQFLRNREFTQLGCEVILNSNKFKIKTLEILSLVLDINNFLNSININAKLEINYLNKSFINDYINYLNDFFAKNKEHLSKTSQEKIGNNVLRILESQEIEDLAIMQNIKSISNYYSQSDIEKFKYIENSLKELKIPFNINEKIVRGLDYYDGLVFEFVSNFQNSNKVITICGGGEYKFKNNNGIGFSIGLERLIQYITDVNNFNISNLLSNVVPIIIRNKNNNDLMCLKIKDNITKFLNKKKYNYKVKITNNKINQLDQTSKIYYVIDYTNNKFVIKKILENTQKNYTTKNINKIIDFIK